MACDTPEEQQFLSNGIVREQDALSGEEKFVVNGTVCEEDNSAHTVSAEDSTGDVWVAPLISRITISVSRVDPIGMLRCLL